MSNAASDGHAPPAPAGRASWLKLGVAALALGALFVLGREAAAAVPRFAAWVDGLGPAGPAVFMAGYAVAVVGFVPGSILTLAAGAVFGLAEGTLYAFSAATVGACTAFVVARYVARGAVEQRLADNERFRAIDEAIGREGRKIVFLLRLSPAFPFSLLNYALGLTNVRFADYALACLGMLPGTLLYVYYGRVLGSVAALAAGERPEGGWEQTALLVVGLVATVVVTTIITRTARRALRQEAGGEVAPS